MLPVQGRPFLSYLIEQVREQGFEEVLLLLGYLPEVVTDYFGDGRKFGIDIRYSVIPPEHQTLRRIRAVRDQLRDLFLLLYCDNYWPMHFEQMWRRFVDLGAPALATV